MRICHIVEAAGGGSGQVVLNLARHGLAQGDEVTVIYAPERGEAKFVAALQALPNLRVLPAPMKREVGLTDIADAWRLQHVLAKAGPFDIIHGHSSKAGALSRFAGLFLPGKVVYTPHGFYSMMPGTTTVYGHIERILSWLCSAVICVSLGEYRHGEELHIAKKKLRLVPNGATPVFTVTREQARRNLGIGDNKILFGFVGRLVPQKNPVRAINAFAQIIKRNPNAHLVVAGDGELRDAVEAERARLGIEKHIDMLGYCEARGIIPALDCLLGSSDFETLPISFLECLNAGVPIVTTPIGGMEEAIVEGETGFAADDFSNDALADALALYLACTPEQRARMSANALQHAQLYTAEIMGAKYRDLYRSLSAA